jgi:hypothetical protein
VLLEEEKPAAGLDLAKRYGSDRIITYSLVIKRFRRNNGQKASRFGPAVSRAGLSEDAGQASGGGIDPFFGLRFILLYRRKSLKL